MPAEVRLLLVDPTHGRRDPTPKQLHGLVSTLLAESDEQHAAPEKPWSTAITRVSPTELEVAIGWLPIESPPPLAPTSVRLGPSNYPITAIDLTQVTFERLASHPADEVGLEILTPTWTSRDGQATPFPDPIVVFTRLIARWNRYAPPPAHIDTTMRNNLLDTLELRAWSGETWRFDLGRGARTGFVGRVVVGVTETGTRMPSRLLGALSGFAELAGIGAQTTFGAGRVQIVR